MATAYTDTVLNYSGLLYSKTDNNTRLLDAVYSRGKAFGDGIFGIGRRKVYSIEYALASGYDIGDGEQPEISESESTTAPDASPVTRGQEKNAIQIFQQAVDVSYLKQSAVGTMAGINIAGQTNNVSNELDFQIVAKMQKTKKDLDYTLINGTYQESTSNTMAWKTRGLIEAIETNVAEYDTFSAEGLNNAITAAIANGFLFDDGRIELWVNPSDLNTINTAFSGLDGFSLPSTRVEGGLAITRILTNYGYVNVEYDPMIPSGTMLLLNMNYLAIAEMDVYDRAENKGNFFYEPLARVGAALKGQLYGQAGIDYGPERMHIKLTASAASGG